jgi:hypothetical protein
MTATESLLGCWHVVRVAGDIVEGPETEMDFRPAGDADHAVLLPDGWQVFRMNYRIEGDVLILEVHSPGRSPPERLRFRFEPDGTLLLALGNGQAWLKRGDRRAPIAT